VKAAATVRRRLSRAWAGTLLAGVLCACAAPEPPLPRKALIDVAAVDAAIGDEIALNGRADCLAAPQQPWFAVEEGNVAILVTAPHVTRPFREGAYRFADGGGTGALARALHRLSGVSAVYTVDASPSDPNFYDDNDFKRTLDRLIGEKRPVLLLDIHASSSHRPYDVDLGTMEGASLLGQPRLLPELVAALRAEGIGNLSLDYFSAAKEQTITKFAAARGVPAIQLEINATWLQPSAGDLATHRFAQLLQALVRYVDERQPGSPGERNAAAGGSASLDGFACATRLPSR
jgi:hypothetical protein